MNSQPHRTPFDHAVWAICQRPKMYLMNGTFGEVLAYLEGNCQLSSSRLAWAFGFLFRSSSGVARGTTSSKGR